MLLLLGMVVAGGCLGGEGSSSPSSTTTASSSQTSTTYTSTATETTSTTETPTATTTTSTTTSTTSSRPSTTTTTTTTQTPTEEAYWTNPWEYVPVEIDGDRYIITYYKYDYKIQPNQSASTYEYMVEKSVGKEKIHVYGMDVQGNRVDAGEHEVYAYKTVVRPVKAAGLDDTLTVTVWYVSNESNAFLYPWDVMWVSYASPTGTTSDVFAGIKLEYGGKSFTVTNPNPFQSGLFPYFEGDQDVFNDINEDLGYLYMGWVAVIHLGLWYEWSDVNVLVPQSGAWTDMEGHSWEWSTKPDGSATYGDHSFKLVDFSWKSEGTAEGVQLQGKGKFSPDLPLAVESEGYYSYKDPSTGETTVIYGYIKLEDLKLEKVSP